MILPCGNLPHFWEHLRGFGRKVLSSPIPMVLASFLGAFARIWTQSVKWSYPHGSCLIFGSICENLDAKYQIDLPPWILPHFCENFRKIGHKMLNKLDRRDACGR